MNGAIFDGIWSFGRSFLAYIAEDTLEFRGFIEPLSSSDCSIAAYRKPGIIPKERFRLVAQPNDRLFDEGLDRIVCGNECYRLLTVKRFFVGAQMTHLECILLKTGEVGADA